MVKHNKLSRDQLTITDVSNFCLLQGHANCNNNKRDSPGEDAITNVSFLTICCHQNVSRVHIYTKNQRKKGNTVSFIHIENNTRENRAGIHSPQFSFAHDSGRDARSLCVRRSKSRRSWGRECMRGTQGRSHEQHFPKQV